MTRRITSFILAALLLWTMLPVCSFAAIGEPVTASGKQLVRVPRNQQAVLTAETKADSLTWQVLWAGRWVDIHGMIGSDCHLSFALAKNMLDENHSCAVRCIDGQETVLEDYKVQFVAPEIEEKGFTPVFKVISPTGEASDPIEGPIIKTEPTGAEPQMAASQEESSASAAEPHLLTVEYRSEEGKQILSPWTKVIRDTVSQTVYFPEVQGYAPYVGCTFDDAAQKWVGGTQQAEVTIDSTSINRDILITVIYKPAKVSYLVNRHYQQVESSQYEIQAELAIGLTGTQVDMNALASETPGFTAMWYDEPYILANGKTVVNIYYDRLYYLMKFDLDGGYGTEPIYAQFGSPISPDVPTKPGYTFLGWMKAGDAAEKIVALPKTMPPKETAYQAKWQAEDTADVTVMLWGENPDQPGTYAYMKSLKITAPTGSTVDISTCFLTCPLSEHEHGPSCYYTRCDGRGHPRNPKHGDRWEHGSFWGKTQCIYDAERKGWFTTDGGAECGLKEHIHTEACYSHGLDPRLWTFAKQDNPTVKPDGTTVVNGYYDRTSFTIHFRDARSDRDDFGTITAKWGAQIQKQFNAISTKAGTNNWSEKKNGGSPWTANVQVMPTQDIFFYRPPTESGTSTAYYLGLKSGGDPNNRKDYTVELLTSVVNGTGLLISPEDFLEFNGFTINTNLSSRENEEFHNARFCYTRNVYQLDYLSGGKTVKSEQIPFEQPLSSYGDYVPPYPDNLEKDAFRFEGWYADPGFQPESKINWQAESCMMPAGNISVYAHWVPVWHTVKTYDSEQDMAGKPLEVVSVEHGDLVNLTIYPSHDDLKEKFVGWFYRDEEGREVAFDDRNMPVVRDLNLYAKWSSRIMVDFIVRYGIRHEDGFVTEIAAPLTGKIMAGTEKTFYPKTGPELAEGYQIKYYPTQSSQTVTMNMDPNLPNAVWFYYELRQSPISYTVKYLEKETNKELREPTAGKATDALIYVDFIPIQGYVPDAYTKKLYLSPYDRDNTLIFWYTKDAVHAPMRFTQWVQNVDGSGYTIYSDDRDRLGTIGQQYIIESVSIPGFVENTAHEDRLVEGTLTADGLHLQRFYDRCSYPCEIRFLEEGTNGPIPDSNGIGNVQPVTDTALLGSEILCRPKKIDGWQCVNPEPYTMSVGIELDAATAKNNVYTFYYKKIEPKVNLTIRKSGWDALDEQQTFLFRIKGAEPKTCRVDLTVSILENGNVTVTDLPSGAYVVTEQIGWSWRYTPGQERYDMTLVQDHILDVENTRTENAWLNGMAWKQNHWKVKQSSR